MSELDVRIEGLDELQRKLRSPFAAKPARNFLNRGTRLIQRASRELAPVDRGRLVDSIDRELDTALLPLWGKVGTNLEYAPDVEFDTMPHMPPVAPLEAWATRKGMPGRGWAIALAILENGTEGQRFLRGGVEDAQAGVNALVPVFAKEIEQAAAKG